MKNLRGILFATLIGLQSHHFVYAAAFQFYELGAPIIGTAAVGQTVITNDASTAYYNPAGMASLNTSQLLLGSQLILPYTNFSQHSGNTIRGNNGGNAGSLLPGADGYYVYSCNPNIKFGVSLTTPYGGSLNYNDHWVGRFYAQQMVLYALDLNPVIAYKINNWAAVGGGVALEYANLYQSQAIPLTPSIDGQATLKVANLSPGYNLGVLFTPTCLTKIGLAYRSQIVHHLHGDISFFNISATPNATTKLIMPANVIASVAQKITNQFTILGELGWSHWSSMVNTIVHVQRFSATTPQNWRDTYRVGLGGQYQFTPCFLFQAGASYDSSPTSSQKRTTNLPMDRQIRLGTGIEYFIAKPVTLGLSYEYLNLGKANINNLSANGVLSGSYNRNYANVVQASLNVAY